MLARLRRIEVALLRLEGKGQNSSTPQPQQSLPASGESPNDPETGTPSTGHASGGKLVREAGDTRYVNSGTFWAALEEEEAGDGDGNGDGDGDEDDERQPSASVDAPIAEPSSSRSRIANDGQLLVFRTGTTAPANTLRHLHPQESLIFTLWQVYLDGVDPLLKILHVPTMQRQILRASRDLDAVPLPLEAVMFAVYYAAITSMQCTTSVQNLFSEERHELMARFKSGLEQSLALANFMTSPDVPSLQALTLYLICARQVGDKSYIWTMVGVLFRLATRLGLHRDPGSLGLPPFAAEIRRRLWWHIVILDVRTAEDNDTDPLIYEHHFDTQMPANINDGDLDVDMTEASKGSPSRTEMLFCLQRYEISYAARKIVFSQQFATDNGYKPLSLAEKNDFLDVLLRDLEQRYFRLCDQRIQICFLTVTAARLVLAKMKLTIHHPARNGSSGISEAQYQSLVRSSIEIIEYARELRSNPKYSKWIWLFQRYVEWDAVAFLLHSLSAAPSPSSIPLMLDRAWEAVDGFFRDWQGHVPDDTPERRWRRLLRLRAKAMRRRHPGRDDDTLVLPWLDPSPTSTQTDAGNNLVKNTEYIAARASRTVSKSQSSLVPPQPQAQGWPVSLGAVDANAAADADGTAIRPQPDPGDAVPAFGTSTTTSDPWNAPYPVHDVGMADFTDWSFDNVAYSMHNAPSWDMEIDENALYTWL